MPTYYTPKGKPEVWATAPEGYLTEEEYRAAHPNLFAPTPYHTWDTKTESWNIVADKAEEAVRTERDKRIDAVSWQMERHQSETRQGLVPTDDITVLDAYIQALRDITSTDGFPWAGPDDPNIPWPVLG